VLSGLFCWILLGLALLGLHDLVFIVTLLALFGLLGFLCLASLPCSFVLVLNFSSELCLPYRVSFAWLGFAWLGLLDFLFRPILPDYACMHTSM
jgi:hypothetical protein